MILSKVQYDEIITHTRECFPAEACGIIAGTAGRVKRIYPMKNTSDKPELCYFMDPKEQLAIFKEMRGKKYKLTGIYHSHTSSEAFPSGRDVEMAYYPEAVYVIVSLKNPDKPEIRGYKILENRIEDEEIKII